MATKDGQDEAKSKSTTLQYPVGMARSLLKRRFGRKSQCASKQATDASSGTTAAQAEKKEELPGPVDDGSDSGQGTLTEFHLFGALPSELRQMIWKFATEYKRRVVVRAPYHSFRGWAYWHYKKQRYQLNRNDCDTQVLTRHHLVWTSPTPPPTLLFVNHEARQVARRSWELAFGHGGLPGRIWISFERDDVVFVPGEFPRRDLLGGCPFPGFFRWVPVLRELQDRGGRTVKPVSALAEVWQGTPDMQRIQRAVLVNSGSFIDRSIRFLWDQRLFRSLTTVTTIWVAPLPTRSQARLRSVLWRWLHRGAGKRKQQQQQQQQDQGVLAQQDGHVWVRAREEVAYKTGIAIFRAQIQPQRDEWDETWGAHGLTYHEVGRNYNVKIWLGYALDTVTVEHWKLVSPGPAYVTINGVAY